MIDWFEKLPGFEASPPGAERTVLWLVPRMFLYGTLMVISPSLLTRLYALLASAENIGARWITSLDICCVSLLILLWGGLIVAALSAFVVMVMKGPAYVADAYYVNDRETPCACCCRASAKPKGLVGLRHLAF